MIVTVRKIPFKLVLRERRPIIIEVTIRNNATRERKYVISVEVDKDLSLSPTGLARYDTKKTSSVFSGEKTIVSFKIYPKSTTRPGTYTVRLLVDECVDDYDNVVATKDIRVTVPVI